MCDDFNQPMCVVKNAKNEGDENEKLPQKIQLNKTTESAIRVTTSDFSVTN